MLKGYKMGTFNRNTYLSCYAPGFVPVYIAKTIIPFDNRYQFTFIEKQNILETSVKRPVSNYYLKLNDLSINLLISLKWVGWGVCFFFYVFKVRITWAKPL